MMRPMPDASDLSDWSTDGASTADQHLLPSHPTPYAHTGAHTSKTNVRKGTFRKGICVQKRNLRLYCSVLDPFKHSHLLALPFHLSHLILFYFILFYFILFYLTNPLFLHPVDPSPSFFPLTSPILSFLIVSQTSLVFCTSTYFI